MQGEKVGFRATSSPLTDEEEQGRRAHFDIQNTEDKKVL